MGYARGTNEWYAKNLFLSGCALLIVGFLAEFAGPLLFETPTWWGAMGTDMEILGILVGLVAVFGFGIIAPLVE